MARMEEAWHVDSIASHDVTDYHLTSTGCTQNGL